MINALESAWAKVAAWESNGLTEEMLRAHDGYLKINRGVVMVSEHYLAELQLERDDANTDRQALACQLTQAYRERDAYKFAAEQAIGMGTAKAIMDERDALKHQTRELQETVKVLSERLADMTAERDDLKRALADVVERHI